MKTLFESPSFLRLFGNIEEVIEGLCSEDSEEMKFYMFDDKLRIFKSFDSHGELDCFLSFERCPK